MGALRISPQQFPVHPDEAQPAQWGAPFGTRTRLRAARQAARPPSPLAFGNSFKRALETADEPPSDPVMDTSASPPKRMRAADSRALVVYQPRNTPTDFLYTPQRDAWLSRLARPTVPAAALTEDTQTPIVVEPPDVPPGDVDMELVIDERGAVVPVTERALVPVASASARRLQQYALAAERARSLVHTQTVILAPWRDSDVEMQ